MAKTKTMDENDLRLLGYSSKWVEYGSPAPELLLAQVAWFHTGADKCTERCPEFTPCWRDGFDPVGPGTVRR